MEPPLPNLPSGVEMVEDRETALGVGEVSCLFLLLDAKVTLPFL